VLRDPAGLRLDDRRLADCVEKRRLAVVDVAHDRDDRRPLLEVGLAVLVDLDLFLLVGGALDVDLALDRASDLDHGFVRQRLRDRDHLAGGHHDLDDLRDRDPERRGQVLHGDARRHGHGTGGLRDRLLLLGALVGAVARLARVLTRAGGAGVDHDTALAPATAAAAGTDGAIRSISAGFVCHGYARL
jgi:hypothetical protein